MLVEPLHIKLKQALIAGITAGTYPAGDRIPSERELCEQFHVSRTTTRRTLLELVHEGWLYTVAGKGTYVAERPLDHGMPAGVDFQARLVGQLRTAPAALRAAVRMAGGNVYTGDGFSRGRDLRGGRKRALREFLGVRRLSGKSVRAGLDHPARLLVQFR